MMERRSKHASNSRRRRKKRGAKTLQPGEFERQKKKSLVSGIAVADAPILRTLSPMTRRAFSRARGSFGGRSSKPLISMDELDEFGKTSKELHSTLDDENCGPNILMTPNKQQIAEKLNNARSPNSRLALVSRQLTRSKSCQLQKAVQKKPQNDVAVENDNESSTDKRSRKAHKSRFRKRNSKTNHQLAQAAKKEVAITVVEEEVTADVMSPVKSMEAELHALNAGSEWLEESISESHNNNNNNSHAQAEEEDEISPSKKRRTSSYPNESTTIPPMMGDVDKNSRVFRSHWAPRLSKSSNGSQDADHFRDLMQSLSQSQGEDAGLRRSLELRRLANGDDEVLEEEHNSNSHEEEEELGSTNAIVDDEDDVDDEDFVANAASSKSSTATTTKSRKLHRHKHHHKRKRKRNGTSKQKSSSKHGKSTTTTAAERPHSIGACVSPTSKTSRPESALSPAAKMAAAASRTRVNRSASDGQERSLPVDRAEDQKQRKRLMQELVETEKSYLMSLAQLKEIWAGRLKRIMPADLYKSVFGSLPAIICLSQVHLLPRLQERLNHFEELSAVGDIFMELLPAFKVYTDYLQNHTNFSRQLNEFRKEHKSAYEAVAKQAHEAIGNFHMLESYLIQPVQRLPRYQMLLGSMIKATPQHVDPYLRDAHAQLSNITMEINETMHEYENRARLFELAQRFHPSSRDYLLEHWMARCPELIQQDILETNDDNLPEAACFLLGDTFVVAEPSKRPVHNWSTVQLRAKWMFPLETVFLRDAEDDLAAVEASLVQCPSTPPHTTSSSSSSSSSSFASTPASSSSTVTPSTSAEEETTTKFNAALSADDLRRFHLVNPTHCITFTAKSVKDAMLWKQATEAAIQVLLEPVLAPIEDGEQESTDANIESYTTTSADNDDHLVDEDDTATASLAGSKSTKKGTFTATENEQANGDEPQYLVVGRQNSQTNMSDEKDMLQKHIAALRMRRSRIEIRWERGVWKAIESKAPETGCERIASSDYEKEAEDYTAKALQELYSDPAYLKILEEAKSARTPKKTMFSRIGGAVHRMSPAKWISPSRVTPSRLKNHRAGNTPRQQLQYQQPMAAISPESRRFTSPRNRAVRLSSPINGGTPNQKTIAMLRREASPNTRRRLGYVNNAK